MHFSTLSNSLKVRRRSRSNSLPGWTSLPKNGSNTNGYLGVTSNGGMSIPNANKKVGLNRRKLGVVEAAALSGCGGDSRAGSGSCIGTGGEGCDLNRTCWWEPDREDTCDTVDFALETSLHGLKYICQPKRHFTERIFWMVAFLTGIILAGYLISDVWLTYWNTPLIVTFQPFETTIDKIPFPAITICNMNKVLKSRAEEYIKNAQGPDLDEKTIEARKNVYYLDHVCSSSKSFSQKFNFSSKRGAIDPKILARTRVEDGDDEQRDVAQFLQLASQPCEEMLLLCAWQDVIYNCSDLFKPIETDFGKCCTFNFLPQRLLYKTGSYKRYETHEVKEWAKWDIEKNGLLLNQGSETPKVFPRRQQRAGKSSGLSVLLNPDLEEYFCTSSDSHGFQLVKHLSIDIPKVFDFGIAIRPNSEVFMGIRPEITLADRDIRNFKLEKRNCYFHGEHQLAYYKHYTSSNCYDECLANKTFELCNCVSYFMPKCKLVGDDTRDLCGASNFACAENVRKSALHTGIKSKCDFCLPACTELEYFSETTFTPLQEGSNIWADDFGVPSKWAGKNLSIVHIYFSSDSTYARVRKELYQVTDLIANTGGLMGLCLGFSGLSLVELIYFYTLRAWCRTRRRRSMWTIAALKFHRIWMKSKVKQASRNERYTIEVEDTLQNEVDNIMKVSDIETCYSRRMSNGQVCNRNDLNMKSCKGLNANDNEENQSKSYYFVPEDSKPYYRGCGCLIGEPGY